MKLASKFEAGADTSDIFRQLLEALVDRVRRDLTISFTKFRDRVYKRKSYDYMGLHDEFGSGTAKGSADLKAAKRFLVVEDIPDLANDKNSDVRKAVRKAHKVCDETDSYGVGTNPTAEKRAKRELDKAYKALDAARRRYDDRRWFPIPKTDSNTVIAELVEERIKGLFETFIEKQKEKINDIIKGRAGSVSGVVEDSVWEAYLNFDLVDGTHFEMKMKIKSVVSCCGTPFFQFPTTFHNAHTGSGEKCWGSEFALKERL
jgi:hypothetical protein